jgi:hypothetical protein
LETLRLWWERPAAMDELPKEWTSEAGLWTEEGRPGAAVVLGTGTAGCDRAEARSLSARRDETEEAEEKAAEREEVAVSGTSESELGEEERGLVTRADEESERARGKGAALMSDAVMGTLERDKRPVGSVA